MTLTQTGVTYEITLNGEHVEGNIQSIQRALNRACEALHVHLENIEWPGPCDSAIVYRYNAEARTQETVHIFVVEEITPEILYLKTWNVPRGFCNKIKWRVSDGRILPG